MTVTPIPIRGLFSRFRFGKRAILLVLIAEVLTVGTIFVVIPIMVVLVASVIDPVVILIVSMLFFLASIVLRLCRCGNCCGGSKGCGKNTESEKKPMSIVHVVISSLKISFRNPGSQRVCGE